MSDTLEPQDTPQQPAPGKDDRAVVSKRGRRLLIAIIIVLVLALVAISVLLASLVVPRSGSVAENEESGGIEWVKSIYGWGAAENQQFMRPSEVFIGDNGTIWVTDPWYKFVLAFNPEGDFVRTVGESTETTIQGLGPLCVGDDGRVFVGEPAMDRVDVFDADGADLGMFSVPDPGDMDYRDGTILLGSRGGFAFIDAATGNPKKVFGSYGKGPNQFDTVGGVTYADDGSFFLVDTFNNRLKAYEADGSLKWSVSTGAPGNKVDVTGAPEMQASRETSAPARLQVPADVCLDGNGHLVVVDGLDFSISVFDSKDGKFIAKYGEYGQKDGQFIYPSSIDYDAARDWFVVADAGNSRLQIVRIPDSAGATGPLASARRVLAGPLRVCLAPLALLLVVLIVWLIMRRRRKKQEKAAAGSPETASVDESAGM